VRAVLLPSPLGEGPGVRVNSPAMDIDAVRTYLTGLQDRIVGKFAELDGKPFLRDSWVRPEGGGGVSRLLEEGNLLERGGVGFSHVLGSKLPPSASAHRPRSPAGRGRRWVSRSSSTRATRTCPRCT